MTDEEIDHLLSDMTTMVVPATIRRRVRQLAEAYREEMAELKTLRDQCRIQGAAEDLRADMLHDPDSERWLAQATKESVYSHYICAQANWSFCQEWSKTLQQRNANLVACLEKWADWTERRPYLRTLTEAFRVALRENTP